MIYYHLVGEHGFEAYLHLEKITCFGLDPGEYFWVRCDGQQYGTYRDAKNQLLGLGGMLDDYFNPKNGVRGIGVS